MSRRGSRSPFEAIKTEGGLLPHDLLQRIAARDPKLPGLKDADYGLLDHEREGEVVNRSWTRLLAAWAGFRAALEKEPPAAPATTATRNRWLLPLFQELGFGRLSGRGQAFELDGRAYPISHEHEATHTAVHLLGARVGLDVKTQAVQGAAKTTPHGLVQDFLNRSDAHDWAIVTNGLVLRLLRDSKSITRQAYVEFDLESILDDQRYSEFRVLWLVCHESRFRREGEATCLLEQWFERGKDEGVRALDRLRGGVEEAIRVLGRGFLRHRDNAALRDALGDGRLDAQEYYRQLLRLVYRLIFLFVTEDRNVLLDPGAPEVARERYTRYYATSLLRALATRRRGGPHGDLWTRLKLVMDRLYAGCPELGLPALGSFLWKPEAVGLLGQSALSNEDLLSALRMLVEVSDGKVVMPVAWAQVGADELGSVYESLLELHPRIEREAGSFELGTAAGHERKTTGSYYTPTSLVECLLDSALDPVLDAKCRSKNPEAAILEMRVCDPACGSGHFLVAAARRIARRLAAVRSGDEEPSPDALRHALRDIVGRCIFGVDLNPMAVELCKVSLWLEAVEPGRPLSFLDGHILVGNALIGTTPALVTRGVPDEAFDPLEGDSKAVAKRLKGLNREEREQRSIPFGQGGVTERFGLVAERVERIEREADASLAGIERKARLLDELHASEELRRATRVANAWCAAFMLHKVEGHLERSAVTQDVLARLMNGECLPMTLAEVDRLANEYSFLHWHLAFPQVFVVPQDSERPEDEAAGWSGGFDVVLGNPPWGAERPKRATKLLQKLFAVGKDRHDSFAFFVERSLRIARQDRWIGLVLPEIFVHKAYPECRRLVLAEESALAISSWGAAFDGVTMDCLTVVGRKRPDPTGVVATRVRSADGVWTDNSVSAAVFLKAKEHRINLRRDLRAEAILAQMAQRGRRLADLIELHEGVHSGNARSELFVSERLHDRCVPLIKKGSEVLPFEVRWSGAYIDLSLTKTPARYFNLGRPSYFQPGNILIRRTGDTIISARNKDGYYASNNLFVGIPREIDDTTVDWIVYILNSPPITWAFRYHVPREGKAFAEVKITHLEDLLIPPAPEGWNQSKALDDWAEAYSAFDLGQDDRALISRVSPDSKECASA